MIDKLVVNYIVIVVTTALMMISVDSRSSSNRCPHDAASATRHCLEEHEIRMAALRRTEEHFLAGVDVENIRSLCHQFRQSLECVRLIREACPSWQHEAMEEAVRPYISVFNMCTRRQFIEEYAMVQNCLYSQRDTTDVCFRQFTLSADSYEHHARQNHHSALRSYCHYMSQLSACVEGNVRPWCGEVAAELTDLLVNVSVDLSYKCQHQHHHRHNHHSASDNPTRSSDAKHQGDTHVNSIADKHKASSSTHCLPSSLFSFGISGVFLTTFIVKFDRKL